MSPRSPPCPSSVLLLLSTSATGAKGFGQLTAYFRRCLPALKDHRGRVYVHCLTGVSQDGALPPTAPDVIASSSSSSAKRVHASAASFNGLDLRLLYTGAFRAGASLHPSKMPTVDRVLAGPHFRTKSFVTEYKDAIPLGDVASVRALGDSELAPPSTDEKEELAETGDDTVVDNVVLGGTFDRLHAGHKVLLAEATVRCRRKMTIGVTDSSMLSSKVLPELIQPCQERIDLLLEYLRSCDPSLEYEAVPISDPFGPSIVDPELQMIVGSRETEKGCHAVNKRRKEKGLSELKVILVETESDPLRGDSGVEEEKISSSSGRIRLLGETLRPPINQWKKGQPYVIGMIGTSAGGKSSIGKRLEGLGAEVIDCDKLAHKAYEKGTSCYNKIVEAFGKEVTGDSDGKIDRAALGAKVFQTKENQHRLESIVWPEILGMVKGRLASSRSEVVVLEAAVLLRAGWHREICHQVWGCVLPRSESVKRIVERDGKTEAEAEKRLQAGLTNEEVVEASSVVFCTFWKRDFTQHQVEKAWGNLKELMEKSKE